MDLSSLFDTTIFILILRIGLVSATRGLGFGATGPPEWQVIDGRDGPTLGMYCEAHWASVLERVFNPMYNPAAHMFRTYRSLYQICADTGWGGNPHGNFGAVCSSLTENPTRILFDYRRPTLFRYFPDIAILCRTHCFCTGGRSGPITPNERLPIFRSPVNYYYTEPPPDLRVRALPYLVRLNHPEIEPAACVHYVEGNIVGTAEYWTDCYKLPSDVIERLQCEGDIPLPRDEPLKSVPYSSLRDFCASGLWGGNSYGNVGLACDTTQEPWEAKRKGIYAHPQMGTPEGVYCLLKCWCNDERINPTRDIFRLEQFTIEYDSLTGIFSITANGESDSYHISMLDNGRVRFDGPIEDTSSSNNNGGSFDIDPDDDLAIEFYGRSGAKPNLGCPQKSSGCESRRDCGPGCICRVDTSRQRLSALNKPAEYFSTFCGSLVPLAIGVARTRKPNLGRRNADQVVGNDDHGIFCPCNRTYVSASCCTSDNGIVYEQIALKKGILG